MNALCQLGTIIALNSFFLYVSILTIGAKCANNIYYSDYDFTSCQIGMKSRKYQ